jgi:drug/metabolite transporter (DMT)-like permease
VAVDVLAALGAAVAYGVAAILQSVAARRVAATSGVDPRLLLRLIRRPAFVVALALNVGGYALHLAALRSLPLFLVQAAIAGSVAVTAVLSRPVLGTELDSGDRLAVAAAAVGLAVLAAGSAGTENADLGSGGRWLLVGAAVVVAVAGRIAGRVHGHVGAALLGAVAGLGYAVVGIGSRVLPDLSPGALVGDPAAYAVLFSGVVAFLLYATALQRGEIMTATGPMVVTQTVVPAVVGVVLLADEVRPGWQVPALVGLALAVWGAARLGRRPAGLVFAATPARREADSNR